MEQILLDAGPSERGWHQFEVAARCMRLWAFRHKDGLEFPVTEPLVKGSLLHIGLAHYYEIKKSGPGDLYEPFDAIKELARREAEKAERKFSYKGAAALWRNSVPEVCAALDEYMLYYHDCSWKVLEVERELRAHIPKESGDSTFLFTQRADLIVEDPAGFKWIVDHKSCYRITSKTLRQHILSGQFLGYQVFGRRMYGDKFGGVIINRVKLSSPFGVDRTTVEPAPAAVAGFIRMLQATDARIERWQGHEDSMDYPPAFSDQICYGKYGQCSAFELCRWGKD